MSIPPTIEIASLGMWDSLILMVMALVVFGPRRMPEIGRQIGRLMYELRKASSDFKTQMEEELRIAEDTDRNKKQEEQRAALELSAPAGTVEASSASGEVAESTAATESATATESPYPGEHQYPEIAPAMASETMAEETQASLQTAASTAEISAGEQTGEPAHDGQVQTPAAQDNFSPEGQDLSSGIAPAGSEEVLSPAVASAEDLPVIPTESVASEASQTGGQAAEQPGTIPEQTPTEPVNQNG